MRNEAGHITLQAWLAQWSMTTFLEPKTTLEYLAYLGFEAPNSKDPTAALKITKPRKRRRRPGRVDRNVVLCYLAGAPAAGKSSLLDAFLNRPFDDVYSPTIRPRRAVNSVELTGGKQCYLILEELGQLETAVLENQARLDACDLICYAYDSSDPDSFSHVVELRKRHPELDELPAVYTALKADKDKTTQRSELQPDVYASSLNMSTPVHVSVTWNSISELFVSLAETATNPNIGFPKSDRTSSRPHQPLCCRRRDRLLRRRRLYDLAPVDESAVKQTCRQMIFPRRLSIHLVKGQHIIHRSWEAIVLYQTPDHDTHLNQCTISLPVYTSTYMQ